MVANLANLSEAVDRTTLDRKLADEIQAHLPEINEEIEKQGFSLVVVDGKTFRVTGSAVDKV